MRRGLSKLGVEEAGEMDAKLAQRKHAARDATAQPLACRFRDVKSAGAFEVEELGDKVEARRTASSS